VELTVLGTSPVRPNPGSACAGYLVQTDSVRVLIDCGPGALARYLQVGSLSELDAVLISHPHADHFFDLVGMRYGSLYGPGKLPDPPPIYADAATRTVLQAVGEALDPGRGFWDGIPVRDLHAPDSLAIGDLTVTFAPIRHYVDGWAMRLSSNGATLVYTADTGPSEPVTALAAGADLLLAECTLPSRAAYMDEWGHLAPDEVGLMARAAGVGRLLLTHTWAENDAERLVADAQEAFGGPVSMAVELETYEIR
jgi:ribonuclease BN (tRNA processing enzyme)